MAGGTRENPGTDETFPRCPRIFPKLKFAGIRTSCYKSGTVEQVVRASVVKKFLEEVFGRTLVGSRRSAVRRNDNIMATARLEEIKLDTNPRYEGYGSAEFGNPTIRVNGPAVVSTDARGKTTAEMKIENVPSASSPDEGFASLFRDVFGITNTRTECIVRVDCAEGAFFAAEQASRSANIDFPGRKASIKFDCFRSEFVNPSVSSIYWRLPIWNFHGDLRPAMSMPEAMHPIRLSDDTPASSFEFLGELGFIKFVPDYKELLEKQKNGDRNPRVTAVMVGAAAGHPTTWESLDSWFPFDFLNLLGFASGSRVGAPWIEFLDAEGHVAKRVHVHMGTNRFETGDAFIHDIINRGGVGRLLTCAGKSAEFKKVYLTIAMNHLLLGVRDSQTVQDKISHLSRALDALAGEFGLGTQYLLESASDSVRSRVKDVLRTAATQIAEMAGEQDAIGRKDVASSLRRIVERTKSTPANVDRDFGLTVISLLERFGFHDATVVNTYYQSNPRSDGRQWHQVLSNYRGLSQHGGAFRFREKEHSPVEVYRLSIHLADIIARIILKQLNYDGEYQRATGRWRDSHELDWVMPDTPAIELGYGRAD